MSCWAFHMCLLFIWPVRKTVVHFFYCVAVHTLTHTVVVVICFNVWRAVDESRWDLKLGKGGGGVGAAASMTRLEMGDDGGLFFLLSVDGSGPIFSSSSSSSSSVLHFFYTTERWWWCNTGQLHQQQTIPELVNENSFTHNKITRVPNIATAVLCCAVQNRVSSDGQRYESNTVPLFQIQLTIETV